MPKSPAKKSSYYQQTLLVLKPMNLHFTLTLLVLSFTVFSQSNPRYLAKPIDKRGPIFCYSFYDGSYAGLGYGLSQKQISLKAHNIILRRPLWKYNTDIDYRTPHNGSRYLDVKINRMHDVYAFNHNYQLRTSAGYKRIKSLHQKITEQFFVGSCFDRNRMFNITLAYARQQQQIQDEAFRSSDGFMIAVYKDFWDELIIDGSAIYWFDQWQYSVSLRQELKHAIYLGVGWERVNDWWDVGVEVGMRM
jgi:hypothetical protein